MKYSKIIGTGSYLPEKIVTNADLEKIMNTSDEWIYSRTGIRERHIARDDETSGDMAEVAAQRAMQAAAVAASEDETLEHNQLKKTDLDWLIPHQANHRIITATARKLGMKMDQVIVTVDKHGNTSAGSVPLALDTAVRSGKIKRGEMLLLEAFGGGFTWASALIRY